MSKIKTAEELFNENFDDISTSLMDFEGFRKALIEHDKEMQANRLEAEVDVNFAGEYVGQKYLDVYNEI